MNSTPTSSEAELRLKELPVIRDGEPCAQGPQHRAPVSRAFGGKGLRLCVCWGAVVGEGAVEKPVACWLSLSPSDAEEECLLRGRLPRVRVG